MNPVNPVKNSVQESSRVDGGRRGARVGGASREARRPIIAPYRNGTQQRDCITGRATGRGRGAGCQAAHRAEARRRDGDIAPYRNGTGPRGTRGRTAMGPDHGVRGVRTAMGLDHGARGGARRWDRSTGTARGAAAHRERRDKGARKYCVDNSAAVCHTLDA